jgi:anionic cell wall polymer biosynthesis LytR-Cps2A-Psr (LCP) family protein
MRKKVVFISIGIAILIIFLTIGGSSAIKFYNKPQAPTLNLVLPTKIKVTLSPTSTPVVQIPPTNQKVSEPGSPATPTETPKIVLKVTPTIKAPVCGQIGTWTILTLGRSTRHQERTRSIRLIKVDFDQSNVLVYSLPPYLALDTPGLVAEYNIKYSYLEDIFPKVEKVVGESSEADFKATQALSQVLLDNFGVPIDHYITIQDTVLMEAVDALGGIYINVAEDFTLPDDTSREGEVIKAGIRLFDGDMIRAYVSELKDNEDEFVRLARQNAVLEGMRKKMVDPNTLLKVIELYSVYKKNVVTDLSLEQMTSLGCLARLVPRDQIVMKEPAIEEILYWEDGSMHFKDLDAEAQQLQELFGVTQP